MIRPLPILLFLLLVAAGNIRATDAQAAGDQILAGVRARFPADPVTIRGTLDAARGGQTPRLTLRFTLEAEWGAPTSSVCYTLFDAFGTERERLTVRRSPSGLTELQYAAGAPLMPAPLPDPSDTVRDLDVAWMDLTLDALWWSGAQVVDLKPVRGRLCHVIDVPAPASAITAGIGDARLWVDREFGMLLQAETRDRQGNVLRGLYVRSFKKRADRWMIKDMDLENRRSGARVRLSVESVTGLPDLDDTAP